MQEAVRRMLSRYTGETLDATIRALREILQEVSLLGLWRARFFEHAAFYGGTALRILHGLDRFSEDMDFTLLEPHGQFNLDRHTVSLAQEIKAFGFDVEVHARTKSPSSAIQSAFLKADTRRSLLEIGVPPGAADRMPRDQTIKIKLEVDTDPPPGFATHTAYLLQPIPFSVRACSLPDLFAGKIHAALFRRWKTRVKGRDWYDFVWFAGNHPELNLSHLEARMRQTGDWTGEQVLTSEGLLEMLGTAIDTLNVDQARQEVLPFLRHPDAVEVWSQAFFRDIAGRIRFV